LPCCCPYEHSIAPYRSALENLIHLTFRDGRKSRDARISIKVRKHVRPPPKAGERVTCQVWTDDPIFGRIWKAPEADVR
jgi:hypothetical protein